MKKLTRLFIFLLFLILNSCSPGRPQIPVGEVPPAPVPSNQEQQKAEEFKRELRESGLLTHERRYTQRVEKIVNRILSVVDTNHSWDTFVIKEDSFNAATLLGSIILVNTGLLDMFSDDNEVAVVMAHEVAHSLAAHFRRTSGEMTNEVIAGLLGIAIGAVAIDQGLEEEDVEQSMYITQAIMRGAIVNPHSREREREADRIGIFAMADAGYDPRAAVRIWERMAEEDNSQALAFFSTHPPSQERAQNLRSLLPMALERYRNSTKAENTSDSLPKVTLSISVSGGDKLKRSAKQKINQNKSLDQLLTEGKTFIHSRNYSNAENVFREILEKDSTHKEALYFLGYSLLEQKKNKEAKKYLLRAVVTNFYSAKPAYDLARTKARLGDFDSALKTLRRACSLDNSLKSKAASEADFVPLRKDPGFMQIVKGN